MSILEAVIKSRGNHYCHAIEVSSVYELTESIEALCTEFYHQGYDKTDMKLFFSTISVYSLSEDDSETDLIHDLNIDTVIDELNL